MASEDLLSGLILAGGKSIRMGQDKAQIEFHNKPQLYHLHELLTPFCNEVYFSVHKDNSFTHQKRVIKDLFDIESPLNGILSAFHYSAENAWLSVAIDMPNITNETLVYLIKNRDKTKSATCFYDSEGVNPEPLLTIWEPRSRPQLLNFFNRGKVSPRKFLIENEVCLLKTPDPSWLVNVNTPKDLESFKKQNS